MCSLSAALKDAQTLRTCWTQKQHGRPGAKYVFTVKSASCWTILWSINTIKQCRFKRRVSDCWCKLAVNLWSAFSPQLLLQTHGHSGGRSFIPAKRLTELLRVHYISQQRLMFLPNPGRCLGCFPAVLHFPLVFRWVIIWAMHQSELNRSELFCFFSSVCHEESVLNIWYLECRDKANGCPGALSADIMCIKMLILHP